MLCKHDIGMHFCGGGGLFCFFVNTRVCVLMKKKREFMFVLDFDLQNMFCNRFTSLQDCFSIFKKLTVNMNY